MVVKTVEPIKARIGMMSCVGINTNEYPVSFGNYFDFASGERALNMWAENLQELKARTGITEIECTVFSDGESNRMAFITDRRVPDDWVHEGMCMTGRGWGSVAMAQACHLYRGESSENAVCGCEGPEQSPHICQHFDYPEGKPKIVTNMCLHCKRRWPNTEQK